jgi:hypothetical protein
MGEVVKGVGGDCIMREGGRVLWRCREVGSVEWICTYSEVDPFVRTLMSLNQCRDRSHRLPVDERASCALCTQHDDEMGKGQMKTA